MQPQAFAIVPIADLFMRGDTKGEQHRQSSAPQHRTAALPGLGCFGDCPRDENPEADLWQIGVTICPGLRTYLNKTYDWNEHPDIPKPTRQSPRILAAP